MMEIESHIEKQLEKNGSTDLPNELSEIKEFPKDIEAGEKPTIESPDILYIERTSRTALMEKCSLEATEKASANDTSKSEAAETKAEGLTEEEKAKIKEETGWSDEIIDNIKNMKQYEILKNAGLIEVEINGRKCLVKSDLDLDTPIKDAYGREKTNRERIAEGSAPLDPKTGHPLELHHLGQSADSPLVELTREEHRTGEYEDGKKNQSLWHDNTKETEVHGEGNNWASERENHWSERIKQVDGGNGNE